MLLAYHVVARPLAKYIFWRFGARAEGVENIPRTGPVILAGKHQSEFDAVLVVAAVPRRVRMMIKADEDAWKRELLRLLVDTFTIKRNHSDTNAMKMALRIVGSGEALCVFPEAHRSRLLIGFHHGISTLARRSGGVPLVPFAITGSDQLSVGTVVRNLHRGIQTEDPPTIRFGKPFTLPAANNRRSKDQRQADTDLIRGKVMELMPTELIGEDTLYIGGN